MTTVVLLSGGLDSTVLMADQLARGNAVVPLTVLYGQRHARELTAASHIAAVYGMRHVICDVGTALAPIFESAESSQVGQCVEVPEGHYAHETMKRTIVPNRNMILLSIAGALAVSEKARSVAYAAHSGDHPVYPDCRPEFIEACQNALREGSDLDLLAPFRGWSKADIVRRGYRLNVPLAQTYSCYKGGPVHCGRCSTCVERREAFALVGVFDHTEYEDQTDFWKTATGRA
jgi:7-cyano-7-deazaguanine synthase